MIHMSDEARRKFANMIPTGKKPMMEATRKKDGSKLEGWIVKDDGGKIWLSITDGDSPFMSIPLSSAMTIQYIKDLFDDAVSVTVEEEA